MKPMMMGWGPPAGLCVARRGSKWNDRYNAVLCMKIEKTVRVKKNWDWMRTSSLAGWAEV